VSERRLLVVNGPNLGKVLGSREPEVYGRTTLADLWQMAREKAASRGYTADCFQSNSEGEIIDFLEQWAPGSSGVVINGGALTHYSYALYDCLKALSVPVVEVHLTNLHGRPERFRSQSVTAPAAVGIIAGLGPQGYLFAMEYLIDRDQ
jgi:3-dehydroquinate dehydratase II